MHPGTQPSVWLTWHSYKACAGPPSWDPSGPISVCTAERGGGGGGVQPEFCRSRKTWQGNFLALLKSTTLQAPNGAVFTSTSPGRAKQHNNTTLDLCNQANKCTNSTCGVIFYLAINPWNTMCSGPTSLFFLSFFRSGGWVFTRFHGYSPTLAYHGCSLLPTRDWCGGVVGPLASFRSSPANCINTAGIKTHM